MNLFSLFATIGLKDDGFTEGINKATNKGSGFKEGLQKMNGVVNKVGTAVTAGAVAMGAYAVKTAGAGDRIDKMSQKLGLSRKGFQEWDYILSQNGASIDAMGVGMKSLQTQMENANNKNKTSIALFKELGISMQDVKKSSPEQMFETVVKRLQEMPAGAEKTTMALKLFGRQGMELMPLLNGTAGSVEELKKKAHELGIVIGDEGVDNSVKFTDALDTFKRSLGGTANEIGGTLLPALTDLLGKFTEFIRDIMPYVKQFLDFLARNIQPISILIGLFVGFTAVLKGLMFITSVIETFQTLAGVLGGVKTAMMGVNLAFLANPITWLVGLIVGLVGAFIYLWNTNEGFRQFWIDAWNSIKQGFSDAWNKIKEGFNGMVEWLQTLPSKIGEKLSQVLNSVKQWGSNMWSKAKEIGSKFTQWVVNGVKSLPGKMLSIGKDIVRGIWNGITGMGGWLMGKIKGWANNIVSGIKNFFDIHSPSRVMRDQVGKFMAMGIGVGFEEEMDNVNADIQSSLTVPDVPTVQATRQNDLISLVNAILALANRPNRLEIDGREVMIALAPYQDEFEDYNRIRNINFAK